MTATNEQTRLPWRPIAELADKYAPNLLLLAPELVDLDCNEYGVGMGYFQDDAGDGDCGSFLACKWSMTNDEWREVVVTPTHFLVLSGTRPPVTGQIEGEVVSVRAQIVCGGCGNRYTVRLDTGRQQPAKWTLHDEVVETVREGLTEEHGLSSVQGGHMLCAACTRIVDNDPVIPEDRAAESPEEVRAALSRASREEDEK